MSDVYDPDVEHELNTQYTGETRMTYQQQVLCDVCQDPVCACSARGLTTSQYKALKEIVHPAAGSWNKSPSGEPIAADVAQMIKRLEVIDECQCGHGASMHIGACRLALCECQQFVPARRKDHDDLTKRLRKMAVCVYLAAEAGPAADIADGINKAVEAIEQLQNEITALKKFGEIMSDTADKLETERNNYRVKLDQRERELCKEIDILLDTLKGNQQAASEQIEEQRMLFQAEHLITQSLRGIVEQQRVMLLKAEADLKRTEPDIGSDVPGGGAI